MYNRRLTQDRTRLTVALILQRCARLSSVTLCIVDRRCSLEQELLLLTAYRRKSYNEKSIGSTKMNDFDLCLKVIYDHVTLCQFAIDYLGNR